MWCSHSEYTVNVRSHVWRQTDFKHFCDSHKCTHEIIALCKRKPFRAQGDPKWRAHLKFLIKMIIFAIESPFRTCLVGKI